MKEDFKTLVKLLAFREITEKEFIRRYFEGKEFSKDYFPELLKKGLVNKDPFMTEEALILIFAAQFYDDILCPTLCSLLNENWHYKHEDIASLLKDINDPSAVNCLYSATELHFEYLNYDDTFQFARKCIKALAAIGNENAIDKLRLLTTSENSVISAYAKKELRYKHLE